MSPILCKGTVRSMITLPTTPCTPGFISFRPLLGQSYSSKPEMCSALRSGPRVEQPGTPPKSHATPEAVLPTYRNKSRCCHNLNAGQNKETIQKTHAKPYFLYGFFAKVRPVIGRRRCIRLGGDVFSADAYGILEYFVETPARQEPPHVHPIGDSNP